MCNNASHNWWGSSDGPGPIASVSGDNVSDNVIFEPWLTEPVDDEPPVNQPPVCTISANPDSGDIPLSVTFSLSASDTDGSISSWKLDIDNDGTPEHSGTGNPPSSKQYTYSEVGTFTAKLTVYDDKGKSAYSQVVVVVDSPEGTEPLIRFAIVKGWVKTVEVSIENFGDFAAVDVDYSIAMKSCRFNFIEREKTDTITVLSAGDEEVVTGPSFFGVGKVDITVVVDYADVKTARALVLGKMVMVF